MVLTTNTNKNTRIIHSDINYYTKSTKILAQVIFLVEGLESGFWCRAYNGISITSATQKNLLNVATAAQTQNLKNLDTPGANPIKLYTATIYGY